MTIASGEGTEFTGKVSAARTDASGVWTIKRSFVAAEYYARVAAALVQINGFQYRCSYAWSMPRQF